MSPRPWYKRYPSDFLAGTTMLTAEEKGVYSTIIDILYDRGGPIEDSSADLARICGCASPKRFQRIKERLVHLGKLATVGNRITNARFERDSGAAGRASSSGDPPNEVGEKPPPDLLEINGLASPLPEARSQIPKPSQSGAKARLPTGDLSIPKEWIEYAASKGFDVDSATQLFQAFVDHHRRHANAWADWDATWRTWVRNEIKFSNRNRGGPNGATGQRGGGGFSSLAAQIAKGAVRHE